MRRIIMFALLCLTMVGGVASADRYRGPSVRDHRGGVSVQPRYEYRQSYRPTYRQSYVRPTYRQNYVRYDRHPIYVQRPAIRYHYYNYYQRPSVIVENYPAMTGYYWVAGQWTWSGYEWIWMPGHYEPDPQYYDSGY